MLLDTFDGDSQGARRRRARLRRARRDLPRHGVRPDDHRGLGPRAWAPTSPGTTRRRVAAASVSAHGASIDLFDPADEGTTFHVEIAVDGPEVTFEATIAELRAAQALGDADAGVGPLNQMGQSFVLAADEHFFGLGEQLVTRRSPRPALRVLGRGGRHRPGRESVPPGPAQPRARTGRA